MVKIWPGTPLVVAAVKGAGIGNLGAKADNLSKNRLQITIGIGHRYDIECCAQHYPVQPILPNTT